MGSVPKEIELMEKIADDLEELINEDSTVALEDSWFVNKGRGKRFYIPFRPVLRWLQYHKPGIAPTIKDKYDILGKLATEVRNRPKGVTKQIPLSSLSSPRLLKSNLRYFIDDLRHIAKMVREEFKPEKDNGNAGDNEQATPETDPKLIYQADAAEFYNIPKSTLSKAAKKKMGEAGYLWSGRKGKRVFYRKKDIEKLARSCTKLSHPNA